MSFEIPQGPVPLRTLFLKMGGWFVLIGLLLLLIFSIASHFTFETAKRFEREGRLATATVTERYSTEGRDSDGNRTTTYWLTFDYTTEAGEEISLNRSVNSAAYRSTDVGEPFELLYLESEPRRTEVDRGSNRSAARVMQIVALVMGLVWLWGLWLVGGWAVSAVRARRYGTEEQAEVTDVRRTNVRVNNKYRYRLIWTDSQGREGKSLMHKPEHLTRFQRGQIIKIYHGIKYSWWVGDVGERDGNIR